MNNYLTIVSGAQPVICVLKSNGTESKFGNGSMNYEVVVNGVDYTWTATKRAVDMLKKLNMQQGMSFRIAKEEHEGKSRFRIWDMQGVEATFEKGEYKGAGGSSGYSRGSYSKGMSNDEKASIMSQWATGAAIQSLQYLGRASTDEELLAESKRVYLNKVDMQKFILDDINERKEGNQS